MEIAHAGIADIAKIIQLNEKYLTQNLTEEQQRNGFLGKTYSHAELERIIANKEMVIAKHQDTIAGYYLIADKDDKDTAPYDQNKAIASLITDEVPLARIAWPCMVCIDEAYRGRGLFGNMLQVLMQGVKDKYTFVLCSISEKNIASIKAHLNNGWELINTFEGRQYFKFALSATP